MKQLSFRARRHVWPTRLLIVLIIYPLLNFCGLCLGAWLEEGGIHFSMAWAYPLSLAFLLVFFTYPPAKSKTTYRRRKVFDLALAIITFFFIVLTGNGLSRDAGPQSNTGTGYTAMASDLPGHPKKTAAQKKGLRKFMKELRARYKKTDDAGKAGLIVLAVVIAVGLLFLISALACSAACGGAEGLAYVIFFIGLAAIVFGLVRVIQRISHGPRKRT